MSGQSQICILRATATTPGRLEDEPELFAIVLDEDALARVEDAATRLGSFPDYVRSIDIDCPGFALWLQVRERDDTCEVVLCSVESTGTTACSISRRGVVFGAESGVDDEAPEQWRTTGPLHDALEQKSVSERVHVAPQAMEWIEERGVSCEEAERYILQQLDLERLVSAVESAAALVHRAAGMPM